MRLAVRFRLLNRDELARSEMETVRIFDGEFEVLGLVRQEYRTGQTGRKQLALAGLPRSCGGLRWWKFCFQNRFLIGHNVLDARAVQSTENDGIDGRKIRH